MMLRFGEREREIKIEKFYATKKTYENLGC